MPAVVRRATVDDVEDLLRLRVLMWTSAGDPEPVPGEWSENAERDLRARLAEPDGDVAAFVVDGPDGRPVSAGFGIVGERLAAPRRPNGKVGWVSDVVTEPDWRGKGMATAVMTELVRWFAAKGVRQVELRATDEAVAVYERVGFRRYDERMYVLEITPEG